MSLRRAGTRIALVLASGAMLASCAVQQTKTSRPATVIAHPESRTTMTPLATEGEPWTSLTASFVLQDCAEDPEIRSVEAMYTRSPRNFEALLRTSLPLMMYVQKELLAAGIPGEFAMLPMLESSYVPHEPSRRGDAAGMWQLMPRTARLHGVVVSRDYDGRLDPVASTAAAIRMLTALEERFGDWRLVDMAYNAGPYAVLGALRKNPDPGSGPIPNLDLSQITHRHLAKLMGLACILRDPQRFHIELPQPTPDDELIAIEVPADTRIAAAADMAGIPEARLREINPGYRGTRVPADSPRILLLPAPAARSLADALAVHSSESVAEASPRSPAAGTPDGPVLPLEPDPPDTRTDISSPAPAARVPHHRVRKGDTLWSIAHRYHVSIADLKRWNDLHGNTLRPGELLQVGG